MTAKSSGVVGGSMCGGEGNMIRSLAGFDGWSDFPKGLRVLLLEHDDESAAQTRLELEQMDYIVSSFSSESEALEAVSSRPESFHVAVVEVNSIDHQESFRFLETARGLPTIMFCEGDCLSTMMQCIALGAAEILRKPLSDEKLRNIWQHVLHKALSAGENSLCRSLKPIRETATTTFQLQLEKQDSLDGDAGPENREAEEGGGQEQSLYDGLPFPSTPQLEQVLRHLDSADSLDPSIYSAADHDCEITAAELAFSSSFLESVDITCDDMNCDDIENTVNPSKDSAICTETNTDETIMESSEGNPLEAEPAEPREHEPGHRRGKNSKKKLKVDWTPDLHRRFVQAVEQLGIEQAIPSKILSLMKVEGLTRHNIASHLQKYRMQRKHALPREEDRRWLHRRDSTSRVYAQKPLITLPPLRSNLAYPAMYPGWSHPSFHHPPRAQMWGHHAGFYPWNSNQAIWPWKSHTRMQADAWGCPVYSPQDHYPPPQIVSLNHIVLNQNRRSGNPGEAHLREEVIDEVVKEAISKPWLPLPIGLKPPSTDSVLAELQRQGIRSIPPSPRQCSLL